MKKFKVMLSVFMVLVIISISVAPTLAVIVPEVSVNSFFSWTNKIDEVLLEKMNTTSNEELIPVWVWMTDIDMDALEEDIETQTGLTQQKIAIAKSDIGYDSLVDTLLTSIDKDTQTNTKENISKHLQSTKLQRQKIAKDTKLYFDAKRSLAQQRYIATNTTKIKKLGIDNNKIDFQSKLTPSFIAFLTKEEIVETAKSSAVVDMGYYSEYDENYTVEEPIREQTNMVESELTEVPVDSQTLDEPTLHTELKQSIQHDLALDKYNVTGDGIKILHIDHVLVSDIEDCYDLLSYPNNIKNIIDGNTYSVTHDINIPIYSGNHANLCVSYLQSFAQDVQIYCIAKTSSYDSYNNQFSLDDDRRINSFDDVEYAINTLNIDLIDASCNDGYNAYNESFSARWYDAIVGSYNIPFIASAGNTKTTTAYTIDPASGYNSIAVGVYGCVSNTMRDNYRYNPIDEEHRVAYKPDLLIGMDYVEASFGGTSAGAPVVSAIVAMMMELDESLKGSPEIIKAILMASCHEKALPGRTDGVLDPQESMNDGLTMKQGAGKVNALRALNIVACGAYGAVTFLPTQTTTNIRSFYLNQQVEGDNSPLYPMNVSIAWLRENTKSSNDESNNSITLGTKHEINLRVFYHTPSQCKLSQTENSGKQLVYYSQPAQNKEYVIQMERGLNDINDGKNVVVGYAYSVGNFEKVLERADITGPTAIGKTLTADAYTIDGVSAETEALTYQWFSSTDGQNWVSVSGATTSTYTLTESDLNKYFMCRVNQNYLHGYRIDALTSTSVVRYGDADLDGIVNIYDVLAIQSFLANLEDFSDEQMIAADVDGDGNITDADYQLIQKYLGENISNFPVELN